MAGRGDPSGGSTENVPRSAQNDEIQSCADHSLAGIESERFKRRRISLFLRKCRRSSLNHEKENVSEAGGSGWSGSDTVAGGEAGSEKQSARQTKSERVGTRGVAVSLFHRAVPRQHAIRPAREPSKTIDFHRRHPRDSDLAQLLFGSKAAEKPVLVIQADTRTMNPTE